MREVHLLVSSMLGLGLGAGLGLGLGVTDEGWG